MEADLGGVCGGRSCCFVGEGEEDGVGFCCGGGISSGFWETGRSEFVGSPPSSPSWVAERENFRFRLAGRLEEVCVNISWSVSISRRFWC